MSLLQIALYNLNRRKSKGFFIFTSLVLASAAVVAILIIISTMQDEISEQLADVGANIVITADRGGLTFQYGGITIPELVFDSVTLTEADLDAIDTIPDRDMIIAVAPKLIGTVSSEDQTIVLTGVDLPGELAVKPWLRFNDSGKKIDKPVEETSYDGQVEMMEMDYEALILDRMVDVPVLGNDEAIIGGVMAEELGISEHDSLELGGKEYNLIAVFEETGYSEDSQLFVPLGEVQDLLDRPGELTMIELTADLSKIDESLLIAQLENALPHAKVTGVKQAVMRRNELLNTIGRFGAFSGSLIVSASFFTALLTIFASVKERTREIGIFRAIGFRAKDILTIIIAEALLVGFIAGITGYHLGLAVAHKISPALTGIMLSGSWEITALLITVVLTAITGSLAGVLPAIKAARLDPAEALRFN